LTGTAPAERDAETFPQKRARGQTSRKCRSRAERDAGTFPRKRPPCVQGTGPGHYRCTQGWYPGGPPQRRSGLANSLSVKADSWCVGWSSRVVDYP